MIFALRKFKHLPHEILMNFLVLLVACEAGGLHQDFLALEMNFDILYAFLGRVRKFVLPRSAERLVVQAAVQAVAEHEQLSVLAVNSQNSDRKF